MNQAKAYLARATLLAMVAGTAAVVWTGAARAQDEDDVRPVDYVRVCDAYGSGYFYIPGTETCLRIGGYVRYNFRQSENTNSVGTGTLRYGLGNDERYAGSFGKRIDSHGFGVGGYLRGDYGDLSIGKFPVVGAYFGYDGTWGEDSYSSSAMVGYNNITVAALTFAHPDPMYGNGIFSGFMGDGLESSGGLDRDEHRVNLGLKIGVYDSGRLNRLLNNGTAPSTVEDGHGISRVTGRIGLFYEGQRLDAYGVSDFTRNGMVFPGFYQNFQLETRDNTFGLQLGTKVDFDPCFDDRLRTSLSTDLYLGYHSGKGHFYQETGVGGGNTVIQMQDYSDSGLSVGAGISATATYSFDRDTHLSAQLKWNIKSDVTSYYQRPSPNGGNSGFSSDSEQSWTGSIRFARSF